MGQSTRDSRESTSVKVPDLADFGVTHLVGIGGAGMSVVALLLQARGVAVSGCDRGQSDVVSGLRRAGISVEIGHAARHVKAADTLIISTAVRADNPDLEAARARGVRVLHRSEALAALMADSRSVAVAGTHGKTTTTALLAAALHGGGVDASVAVGARLAAGATGAHVGKDPVFIAEADESDGSFLRYQPEIAIVTNLEPDHLDYYGSALAVEDAFTQFVTQLAAGATLIACADDPGAAALAQRAPEWVKVITYGFSETASARVRSSGRSITVDYRGEASTFTLRAPGRHNALNAAAAWLASQILGATAAGAVTGLEEFGGAERRFQVRGKPGGVTVVDDYAHHPTEVAAVISAARDYLQSEETPGRVIAVLQPHLPSRTQIFAAEFAAALSQADHAVVLDVFLSREAPVPGVDGSLIAANFPADFSGIYLADGSELSAKLAQIAVPGDIILLLGAGDIPQFTAPLLAALEERAR